MKKIKMSCNLLLLCALLLLTTNCYAVGNKWIEGTVTKAPWDGEYTFIQLDDVKYTVMKDVDVTKVYTRNGITNKDKIRFSSIRQGDRLLIKVEGNRIYQIEQLR